MFRCQVCGKSSAGSPNRRPAALRQVQYVNEKRESQGLEVVSEITVCTKCVSTASEPKIIPGVKIVRCFGKGYPSDVRFSEHALAVVNIVPTSGSE